MAAQYYVFAAPKNEEGRYHFCDDKPMYRKTFASLDAMRHFWSLNVVPRTRRRPGTEYELAMVIENGRDWGFYGQRRYADDPLLSPLDRIDSHAPAQRL